MTPAQRFYKNVKSKIAKDSDLPNLFVYYLTIELGQRAARVSAVKKCYEECDLHPPSWLASHFSTGLRSKPRRFVKNDGGYRLEDKLRNRIAALVGGDPATESAAGNDVELAGIEYFGIAGASKDCQDAIVRLLQFGDQVLRARILTHSQDHCILLTVNVGDLIAVKSGFSSGYGGEGPRTFSYVLQLLTSHGAEIEEYQVDEPIIERLDNSALRMSDIKRLDSSKPIRPNRWHKYVFESDHESAEDGTLWKEFPPIIPFAIIDKRIADLAISFWNGADDRLLKGYRRLEDFVRERTSIDDHGAALFSQAFLAKNSKLVWKGISDGEKVGRANLFTGAYMAHRNPRAHRELKSYQDAQLTEFLLLNHLYRLEKEAHLADQS
jgi:hypothetical protein